MCRMNKALTYFLLVCSSFFAKAESSKEAVEVIAIEYPPYTSEYTEGFGLAFQVLNRALSRIPGGRSDIVIQPYFLPPARANFRVMQGRWSASFYPPLEVDPGYHWLRLGSEIVELGLFRIRPRSSTESRVASWPELSQLTGRVAVGRQAASATLGLKSALRHTKMELVQVDSLEQGFQLLAKGRVDFVFSEKLAGYLIAESLIGERQELDFTDKPVFTTNIGLWVNRKSPRGESLYQALKGYQPIDGD